MIDANFEFIQGQFAYQTLCEPERAKVRLTKAAKKGHAEAQHLLGVIYEEEGAYRLAVKYFRLAAWQGQLPQAQYKLASLYYDGHGVKRDVAEAVKWIRAAAEGGSVDARHSLGMMYFRGEGIAQDSVEAYKWLTAALADEAAKVAEAVREAQEALAALRTTLPQEQVKQAERLAAKLKPRKLRRRVRVRRTPQGPRIWLGRQLIMGSVMDWSVEYEVQQCGDLWKLYVSRETRGWDREGPTDAEGLIAALDERGLDVEQFVEDLRQEGLHFLAQEMEYERG
jgi:hypothetical protein